MTFWTRRSPVQRGGVHDGQLPIEGLEGTWQALLTMFSGEPPSLEGLPKSQQEATRLAHHWYWEYPYRGTFVSGPERLRAAWVRFTGDRDLINAIYKKYNRMLYFPYPVEKYLDHLYGHLVCHTTMGQDGKLASRILLYRARAGRDENPPRFRGPAFPKQDLVYSVPWTGQLVSGKKGEEGLLVAQRDLEQIAHNLRIFFLASVAEEFDL
jgi:hypothetical protein